MRNNPSPGGATEASTQVAKWLVPTLFGVLGVCIAGSGLLYGVSTVGVPTQDASPAVKAHEARNVAIAGTVMVVGLAMFAVGVAGLTIVAVVRMARGRA
jgi:hypothetical protein